MTISPLDKKHIIRLLVYYILATGAVAYFMMSGSFKSGPCTPNLDFLSVFLFGIVSLILTGISTYMGIKKRGNIFLLLINLAFFIGWVVFMNVF